MKNKPFKPLELLSDGGEKLLIIHPEQVIVGKELIVAVQPDGEIDFLEAVNVSKVRILARRPKAR